MHSHGKRGGGQKEKQMYNNGTAKITPQKYTLLTYTFIIYSIFLRKSVCPVSVKVF